MRFSRYGRVNVCCGYDFYDLLTYYLFYTVMSSIMTFVRY